MLAVYLGIALAYWYFSRKQLLENMEDLEKNNVDLQLFDEDEKQAIIAITLVITALAWPVSVAVYIYDEVFKQ